MDASAADRGVDAAEIDQVAHLSLQVGRLLLLNGADTGQVEDGVVRFAAGFGCEARLLVSTEALLLTLVAGAQFRTRIGFHIPGMNVGMTAIAAINRLIDAAPGYAELPQLRALLEAIEHPRPVISRWLVVLTLGLTAASLSRLFGGDWPTFAATWLAGAAGTWVRQELGRRGANPLVVPFVSACIGGLIGAIAVRLGVRATPALCLVAPGMILMPGVPLINGVQDLIRSHASQGVSRLAFAATVTTAIALGLGLATLLTGVALPVQEAARVVGVPQDAAFSALAALGFAFLFSVPPRMAWACVLCGVASHTTRTALAHLGIDLVAGTLVGALCAGVLAQLFARAFQAPPAAFAFPGVVAMVPGAYAFRAVIGALRLAHGAAPPGLAGDTLILSLQVVLMVGAIGIGVAAPALLLPTRRLARPSGRPAG
jgi:uncharacterized membrane protein YjjP (DUF1212 family)